MIKEPGLKSYIVMPSILLIILFFISCSSVYAKSVYFTASCDDSKTTLQISASEYNALLSQITALRFHTTTPDKVKEVMSSRCSALSIKVEKNKDLFHVLGYALPKINKKQKGDQSFVFFLFKENHLLCWAYTEEKQLTTKNYSFLDLDDLDYESLTNLYNECKDINVPPHENWDSAVVYMCSHYHKLRSLIKNNIPVNLQIASTESESWSIKQHIFHTLRRTDDYNTDAYQEESLYFFETYAYARNIVLYLHNETLRSLTFGMDIGPFELPEDGSEDPLDLRVYALINK